MNHAYLKNFFVALGLSVSISCSKSSNNNNQNSCDITYSEAGGLQADGQVQYLAGVTGSGGTKIGTLSYQDSAGVTSIQNPSLPWSVYVNLKQGSAVTIKALGVANPGDTIHIAAFADGTLAGTSCP
jgi:hypothetical protein